MPPAPNMLLALAVIVSLALSVVVMALGAILSRLRKLSRPLADTARMVDDLAERQRALEAMIEAIGPAAKPATATTTAATAPQAGRRVDRARPTANPGPILIAVPNLAAAAGPQTAAAMAELGRRFGPIWAMADMGLAPDAIARETGHPVGQVELILGLRRPVATAPDDPPSRENTAQ